MNTFIDNYVVEKNIFPLSIIFIEIYWLRVANVFRIRSSKQTCKRLFIPCNIISFLPSITYLSLYYMEEAKQG